MIVARKARVVATTSIGLYHVLTFEEDSISSVARPGQFVNIAVDQQLLRRPFSIYRAHRSTGEVSVAFDAIGEATRWLAERRSGDGIDVVGPLGHGFEISDPRGTSDLLVGGGYGSAALAFLAEEVAQTGHQVHAILGGRKAERLFRDDVLEKHCSTIELTTDDGSAGAKGIVTDVMPRVIEERNVGTIYACGPMAMLRAVSQTCGDLPCQLAVEEFMACGIGVCWTCVLPVRVNGTPKHLRACTEGPVFDGASVAWA